MKVIISGISGRMGQALVKMCRDQAIEIAGGIDVAPVAEADFPVFSSFETCDVAADVIIDFSRPDALPGLLRYAVAWGIPGVLATTGYGESDQAQILESAQKVPLFQSANMSLGIALLKDLAKRAAALLGDAFDVEIVETHHRRKVDAPSGTALLLHEAIRNEYTPPKEAVFGRQGITGERGGEIGIHALRGGTVAGIHEVGFYGEEEIITLTHTAINRSIFAAGALRAAAFIQGKAPGMYNMDDLVGSV